VQQLPAAGPLPRKAQEEINVMERITANSAIARMFFKSFPFPCELGFEIVFGSD
jgi:hypothetical protein